MTHFEQNRINHAKVKATIEPSKSKRIGKTDNDRHVAASNPCYGNMRIIGTENNAGNDCRIVVCFCSL